MSVFTPHYFFNTSLLQGRDACFYLFIQQYIYRKSKESTPEAMPIRDSGNCGGKKKKIACTRLGTPTSAASQIYLLQAQEVALHTILEVQTDNNIHLVRRNYTSNSELKLECRKVTAWKSPLSVEFLGLSSDQARYRLLRLSHPATS